MFPLPTLSVRHALMAFAIGTAITTMSCRDASAANSEIRVYTDHAHPVQAAPGIKVIWLDAPNILQAQLATNLPANEQEAATIVRQRLTQSGMAWQRQMQQAYQEVTDAWALGLTKVPAVVVDRRYVVYGEHDVAKAVTLIDQYRAGQP